MKDESVKSPAGHTLTIDLPSEAPLPAPLQDTEFVRYALAGTLYMRGHATGHEARLLTGDQRREFEEKMAQYGFPLMPDDPESVAQELNAEL